MLRIHVRRNIAVVGASAGVVVALIAMVVAMPLAGAAPGNQFARPGPGNAAGPFRTPFAGPSQTVCGTAGAGFARCFVQVLQPGSTTQQVPQANGSTAAPNTAGGSPGVVTAPSGLSPSTIDSVYGFSAATNSGAGKTIAIVDAYDDPGAASDLNAFSQQWGLPQCSTANPCFSKVNQAGGTSYPGGNSSWDLEISLDIEWAHALAPAASILLVEANSNSFADLTTAEQYAGAHADYVSNSWGGSEFSGETVYDSAFTAPAGRSVSYFVATGDTGGAVEYPATSPDVVAVGGTSLLFSSSGTFSAENAWSSGGGGCSTVESAPSTQSSFSQYAQAGCNGRRSTPDVSLDADPGSGVAVYDSTPYSGSSGWWTVGGTSASTPMWAAESAVLGSAVNSATVYSATIPFRDVISGSNGHSTLTGYDLATGRGSWAYTPGPSTSLSAALASGNVALTWTAPTGAPPTSYSVYRSTTSGAETLLASGIGTPSFTTAPPPSGTTYYYEVQAVDGAGTGPFSNEASIAGSSPPPTTTVLIPSAGATLSGTSYLDAAAPNATTVEYLLTGGSYSDQVIGTATPTYYGWLFDWDSTTVPNGTYTLRTEAFNSTGHAFSPSVSFTVTNVPPPTTTVLIPSAGATLSGTSYLDAAAPNATTVEYLLTGGSYSDQVIGTATPTYYGWLFDWDSTTVPNGTYTLRTEAFNSTGHAFSPSVSFTVTNVPPPTTTVLIPSAGATLSGTTYLDAAAPNATTVEYLLTGGSYSDQVIGTATPTYYGWLFDWDSTTVPNGTYTLRTEAFNSTGHAFSPSVSFTVTN